MTTPTTTLTPPDSTAAVARVVHYFETLSPASLQQLKLIYSPQAHFTDPFNAVQGVPAIHAIFDHMFSVLHAPHFVVTNQVVQGQHCFLTWEFRFRFKSYKPQHDQVILGASHLVFSANGLVDMHRDYWDAAQELYEKLPLVGGFMRWLKKRF